MNDEREAGPPQGRRSDVILSHPRIERSEGRGLGWEEGCPVRILGTSQESNEFKIGTGLGDSWKNGATSRAHCLSLKHFLEKGLGLNFSLILRLVKTRLGKQGSELVTIATLTTPSTNPLLPERAQFANGARDSDIEVRDIIFIAHQST